MTWRTGTKLGRTLYRDEVFVGTVDTTELAEEIVRTMNGAMASVSEHVCPGNAGCATCFPESRASEAWRESISRSGWNAAIDRACEALEERGHQDLHSYRAVAALRVTEPQCTNEPLPEYRCVDCGARWTGPPPSRETPCRSSVSGRHWWTPCDPARPDMQRTDKAVSDLEAMLSWMQAYVDARPIHGTGGCAHVLWTEGRLTESETETLMALLRKKPWSETPEPEKKGTT